MSQSAPRIRPPERDAILQSLRAGVVPRIGQQHIQVGRAQEVKALLQDIDRVVAGGSGFRFIIGNYGSGKTFFLHTVRSIALERKLVTVHADLSPERRLHATNGQARNLYAELMANMATRSKPEGGALASVVEKFVAMSLQEARSRNVFPDAVIQERLHSLTEMTAGYDFAEVIAQYWRGHDGGNDALKNDAIRWLRGEFATKTDARKALGVRTIIDDQNLYDGLKLVARFVQLAGFSGLLIALDEMVNLYKLTNTQARNANYEQLLHIVNDSTQGVARGTQFVFCGTPDFLMDTRRGLYSYEALESRLQENTFARNGITDYTGPIIRLANLTPEDLFVLLQKLRHVQASAPHAADPLPDAALTAFMEHCQSRIGESYFRTPRTTIKTFLDLLAVLEQHPELDWRELIDAADVVADRDSSAAETADRGRGVLPTLDDDDDDLREFSL